MNQAHQVIPMPTNLHFAAFEFTDLATAPFDTAAYSRLKFGDGDAAKAFGYEMAERFLLQYPEFFNETVVIIPAPSSAVGHAYDEPSQCPPDGGKSYAGRMDPGPPGDDLL
jgi:hypothetical protein